MFTESTNQNVNAAQQVVDAIADQANVPAPNNGVQATNQAPLLDEEPEACAPTNDHNQDDVIEGKASGDHFFYERENGEVVASFQAKLHQSEVDALFAKQDSKKALFEKVFAGNVETPRIGQTGILEMLSVLKRILSPLTEKQEDLLVMLETAQQGALAVAGTMTSHNFEPVAGEVNQEAHQIITKAWDELTEAMNIINHSYATLNLRRDNAMQQKVNLDYILSKLR